MSVPSEEEVLTYFRTLSNWGRWGSDDDLGTVNLVTTEKRLASYGLVEHGRAVSCSWNIDTVIKPSESHPSQRFMLLTGQGLQDEHRVIPKGREGDRAAPAIDYLGMVYHGPSITHLDALSHWSWDGKMYNGYPAEWVTAHGGATKADVTCVADGIITRGVLIDVPKHRGVDWIDSKDAVQRDEVEAILAKQNVTAEEGDALILRTGYSRKRAEHGPDHLSVGRPGWGASCLPFFHDRGISMIVSDGQNDAIPSGYDNIAAPIHSVGITAMGLWLLDGANLEALAPVCDELDTYAFQFIVAAVPFTGATGSAVNPIAVF